MPKAHAAESLHGARLVQPSIGAIENGNSYSTRRSKGHCERHRQPVHERTVDAPGWSRSGTTAGRTTICVARLTARRSRSRVAVRSPFRAAAQAAGSLVEVMQLLAHETLFAALPALARTGGERGR